MLVVSDSEQAVPLILLHFPLFFLYTQAIYIYGVVIPPLFRFFSYSKLQGTPFFWQGMRGRLLYSCSPCGPGYIITKISYIYDG